VARNDYENPVIKIGDKYGYMTIISVSEKSCRLECRCGNKMSRSLASKVPEMCVACATDNQRHSLPSKDREAQIELRDFNGI